MAESPKYRKRSNVPRPARERYESPRARVRENKSNTEGGLTPAQARAILQEESRYPGAFGGRYEIAAVADTAGNLNPRGNPMVRGLTPTERRRINSPRTSQAERDRLLRLAFTEVEHGDSSVVTTRRDRIEGLAYTHYHPWTSDTAGTGLGRRIGVSFSGRDIASSIQANRPMVRARTENYIFSLRPGRNGWGTTAERIESEWNSAYRREVSSMKGWMDRERLLGRLNRDEYNVRFGRMNALASHRATREIANRYGLIYTRRKV